MCNGILVDPSAVNSTLVSPSCSIVDLPCADVSSEKETCSSIQVYTFDLTLLAILSLTFSFYIAHLQSFSHGFLLPFVAQPSRALSIANALHTYALCA